MTLDEKKVAASSYILQFYQEVKLLTTYYVQYHNLLIELESRYTEREEPIPMESTATIIQIAQLLRQSVQTTYIEFSSISKNLKNATKIDIEEQYKAIMSKLIFERKDIENYVKGINEFLVQDIIQALLKTSNDVISEIYGEEEIHGVE